MLRLTIISLILFLLSVVFLALVTLFEPALVGMSMRAERVLTFLLLVLPSAVGSVLGGMSLARGERRTWLAITLTVLNGLFALFHLMVLLIAG